MGKQYFKKMHRKIFKKTFMFQGFSIKTYFQRAVDDNVIIKGKSSRLQRKHPLPPLHHSAVQEVG
jgi:hypothetical protein